MFTPAEVQQQSAYKDEVHESTVHASEVYCSCVRFVRQYRPDLPLMDAKRYTATTTVPHVGATALMYYPNSDTWHVALVTAVGSTTATIAEANYEECEFTTRTLTLPHNRIVGYL